MLGSIRKALKRNKPAPSVPNHDPPPKPPSPAQVYDRNAPWMDSDRDWLRGFLEAHTNQELDIRLQPTSSLRIMKVVDDPRSNAQALAEAIQLDPALTASVMKLANSSMFGKSAMPLDLGQAVVRVGKKQLKGVLLSVMLKACVARGPLIDDMASLAWRHSLVTAKLCSMLAPQQKNVPEAAFMSGLFHDVGVLAVLNAVHEYQKERQLPDPSPRAALEAAVELGYDLNKRVIADWNLPAYVVGAVTNFRSYSGAKPPKRLAALVALSNDLCKHHGLPVDRRSVPLEKHPALKVTGLTLEELPSPEDVDALAAAAAKL